ncbi:PAS-domain containing protein [Mesorhizobium sp. M0204]
MATKSSRQTAAAPESANLTTLAKLATTSYEVLERELRATIAALQDQALRFQTAIENISQGICFFDADERLILCNRRYAEIYRLAPEQLQPGVALREIVERRVAVGTSAMNADAYLGLARAVNSGTASGNWTAELADGRTIQVCHQPMPDGGWVATHEDISELSANRLVVDERISLQTLIDLVPDYMWVKDTESRFVVANRAIASDSGRDSTSDMIGLSDFDLHAP